MHYFFPACMNIVNKRVNNTENVLILSLGNSDRSWDEKSPEKVLRFFKEYLLSKNIWGSCGALCHIRRLSSSRHGTAAIFIAFYRTNQSYSIGNSVSHELSDIIITPLANLSINTLDCVTLICLLINYFHQLQCYQFESILKLLILSRQHV